LFEIKKFSPESEQTGFNSYFLFDMGGGHWAFTPHHPSEKEIMGIDIQSILTPGTPPVPFRYFHTPNYTLEPWSDDYKQKLFKSGFLRELPDTSIEYTKVIYVDDLAKALKERKANSSMAMQ
jgi:hypothetical protein